MGLTQASSINEVLSRSNLSEVDDFNCEVGCRFYRFAALENSSFKLAMFFDDIESSSEGP